MSDQNILRLATALADRRRRLATARELASSIGAVVLTILVEDPDVDAWLPAPGFPPTLPGGAAWREFLQRARQPGTHHGQVGYPTAHQLMPAVAITEHGVTLLWLGGDCDVNGIEAVRSIMPWLAATLRAEHEALTAKGELRVAQEQARHAEALARALDTARSEVERTLRELERQALELDDARRRAEEATQTKDEFLAMLGHELRNPLSPILTALQLMRLKNLSSREQDVIERQVAGLVRLVDDLLDVSRITRGKVELRKERIELAAVAARAIEMSSPVLEKKRQVLVVSVAPRGLMVDADPSRLAQVLANLLTNAAKYSDTDSEILFAAEHDDAEIRIRVKDQGIGLAPEMQSRVFDLFVQNRQSIDRSEGGLGLGLTIVRSLVRLHGGTVRAYSEGEGRGSEFVVALPRAPGKVAPALGPDVAAFASLDERGGHPSERILIVDDNQDGAELLAALLTAKGHDTRVAHDGPTALRLAAEFSPHIAFLDLGLPIMDGYELASHLREIPGLAGLRLVAVTGYGQESDRRRTCEAGFGHHLVKPVDIAAIESTLADPSGHQT